jgi:hypothetical protein
MPQRGPEPGVLSTKYDFHGSGVNLISSCPFQLSKKKYCLFSKPFYSKHETADNAYTSKRRER